MASYSASGATPGNGFAGSNGHDASRGSAPDYSLSGVLHFLQSEWRRYEHERNSWNIERAELRARIALLEGERRSVDNLKTDLLRRIKMLEFALRQERIKSSQNNPGSNSATARNSNDRFLVGGGNASLYDDGHDMNKQLQLQSNSVKLPIGMTDAKGRAKSRAYLQQCLQEIAYLTSNITLNPMMNQTNSSELESHASQESRPLFIVPDEPFSKMQNDRNMVKGSVQIQDTSTHDGPEVKQSSRSLPVKNEPESKSAPTTQETNTTSLNIAEGNSTSQNLANVPDVQLWKSRGTIDAHFDSINSLAYDSSGFGFFTASDDCTIKYWHLPSPELPNNSTESANPKLLTTLRGHEAGVRCLVYSKKLNKLFSGSLDASIRQWTLPEETPMKDDPILDSLQSTVFAKNTHAVHDMSLFALNGKEDALLATHL
ncbi:1,2-dihydroxy-3-keto-5-methylthiopentene dioxygenase [Malassezia arunalokei]|uniref:1,2-dihydroxy-3-keto-5-methylthiopentene dioxygenase n=1 Tax=Malassezia arunalokei TaxID=1514897 RepID=A0AAJ5Z8L2_9BASI|nr:1,2-dihydroxy-3-keto-5-methylthiopentene dioxygenase [Malassezia arunalokei]